MPMTKTVTGRRNWPTKETVPTSTGDILVEVADTDDVHIHLPDKYVVTAIIEGSGSTEIRLARLES
jgi:hypothetical protein